MNQVIEHLEDLKLMVQQGKYYRLSSEIEKIKSSIQKENNLMNEKKTENPAVILLANILTELKELRVEVEAIAGSLLQIGAAAPPAGQQLPAAAAASNLVTFETTEIICSMDDNGQAVYKVRGPLYPKFGIRVWPEVLPKLDLDADQLQPGPNPFAAQVVALMGDTHPKKVINLADAVEIPPAEPTAAAGPPEPEPFPDEEVPF
jgi:hypothetical protein